MMETHIYIQVDYCIYSTYNLDEGTREQQFIQLIYETFFCN